jgi:hypothetical protein
VPRWTLLHHALPDGSSHLDLLLAPDDDVDPAARPDERRLVTFRLGRAPAPDLADPLDVERAPDHRSLYLDYEGKISGGRGTVRRVDGGTWWPERVSPDEVVGLIRLGGGDRRLRIVRVDDGGRWRLELWVDSGS